MPSPSVVPRAMSMLKTIDPVSGQIADPPAPDHRAALREAIQRVEDAYTVGVKAAEDRAAAAEGALAALRKEHDALAVRFTEADKKAKLLDELKAKLASA